MKLFLVLFCAVALIAAMGCTARFAKSVEDDSAHVATVMTEEIIKPSIAPIQTAGAWTVDQAKAGVSKSVGVVKSVAKGTWHVITELHNCFIALLPGGAELIKEQK